MAYARFGWDSSDVYVFMNGSGHLECCGCSLAPDAADAEYFFTTDAMIAHLREHLAAGHVVPDDVIPALEADREENEAYIAAEQS